MVQTFKVKNWSKYQHYHDRNPPWIKLHVEILASEDWVMLDDASRLLMVVCMMIAAKTNGTLSDNPSYLKRVAYLKREPDFKPLIECGFLEVVADASAALADARPEKEGETEEEEEKNILIDGFPEFWSQCPKKVGKGKAKKAYTKASQKTAPATILAGIIRYAASRAGQPEEYTKHPATWLNDECWADESGTGPPALRVVVSADVAAEERENLKRLGVI